MSVKSKTLAFLLVWPLATALTLDAFHAPPIASPLLFFIVPALIMSLQLPCRTTLKHLLFSCVLGIPGIIIIDYIANLTNQWTEPITMFPFRIFDFVSLEVILWAIGNTFVILAFYTLFFERHIDRHIIRPRMYRLLWWFGGVFVLFVCLYAAGSFGLHIPYFYAFFGVTLILFPTCFVLYRHPKLLMKFVVSATYFFYLTFCYEVVALRQGWWTFPSTRYLGIVSVAGVRFPLEEFVFWFMLFTTSVLAFYETFDDDRR